MSDTIVLPAEQLRAADPAKSVWVAASAGTGKTKVLIDRLLNLLLAGTRPERVLCLTFTKAAATEMSLRVAERLKQWATASEPTLEADLRALLGEPPSPQRLAHARRLFAAVLETPGGLAIDTIHAFCQSLLRRFPLEAQVSPHLTTLDERGARELLAEALDSVLALARENERGSHAQALAVVNAHVGEDAFGELMGELLHDRARLARLLNEHGGERGVEAALRQRLGLPADATADSIVAEACRDGAFDGARLRRAALALASAGGSDGRRGAVVEHWLARPGERLAHFNDYLLVYLTKEGGRRTRLATNAAVAAYPDIEPVMAEEAARVGDVVARRQAALNVEATRALVHLGVALIRDYDAAKRRLGALDYDDLILAARDLLDRPGVSPWVLYKLDGGIDHILIDEAQDTNPEQWEVVAKLAEDFFSGEGAREGERTVFAVGDVKQSIYSFQRADPAAFVAMRQHFEARARAAARGWDKVPLTLSFRSTRPVLEVVDAVFAHERAAAGVALDGTEIRHDSHRHGMAGLVELWPPVRPAASEDPEPWAPPVEQQTIETPRQKLARIIATTIARWIRSGERLESRGRAVRPSDIMILVRRRNSLVDELVRALKGQEIDVAGVDRMVLAEQLAVMDVVALGRFLLLPEDDLTLATVLKGPLFNFSEDELFSLAHGRAGALWDELRRRRDERPSFAAARDELARLLGEADFAPPYELFAEILGAHGGRRRIVARLGIEAEDPLDEFLAAALAFERTHPPSLEGFLHWLERGRQEIKRDLETAVRDEVRILTVHGAKGLQAPIVILPDTLQVPTKSPRLLWPERLLLWSPRGRDGDDALAAEARQAAKSASEAEYRRLLYVALTRAEDRLYVCGYATRRDPPEGCWYNLVAPAMRQLPSVEPLVFAEPDGLMGEGFRFALPQETAPKPDAWSPAEAGGASLPEWVEAPPPEDPRPPRPLIPSAAWGAEPTVRSPFGEDDGYRFHRGKLVHRLLQTLPELPPARRPKAAATFLARPVHRLAPAAQAEIAREVLAVLEHPEFAPLFGANGLAEAPIAGRIGAQVIAGQVDRLVVQGGDVLVVDYKTNRPPPARLADVPELYRRQMAAYRAALQLIYPGKRVRCLLLWTYGPRLMELPEKLL